MNGRTLQTIQYDSVADLYDAYAQTDLDLPFWLKECRSVKGEVLELMSGTGRVSIPLLKAGVKLTCVDYAPGMLAQLEKKLRANDISCRTECQDVTELDLDAQYHLIFIPFHSFSEIVDSDKRRLALKRIREHLTDGGTFICSLQNPLVRTLTMDGRNRRIGEFSISGEESLVVDSTLRFDPVSQMATGTQTYDRRDKKGKLIERRELPIAFYLFGRGEFEALAKESGFVVQALYGDYAWGPYEENSSPYMIWKLSKSATTVNSKDPKLVALLLGLSVFYLVVGLGSGELSGQASSSQMVRFWRLAAWIVSFLAYLAHIWYELFRLHNSVRTTAFHASLAAAIASFGLAVAANIHAQYVSSTNPTMLALSLALWPILTMVPAFGIAFIIASGLTRWRKRN